MLFVCLQLRCDAAAGAQRGHIAQATAYPIRALSVLSCMCGFDIADMWLTIVGYRTGDGG